MKKIKFIAVVIMLFAMASCCTSCTPSITIDDGINGELITSDEVEINDYIKRMLEKAYFEGQKDAINYDIRIELDYDGVYQWTESCWNDGTEPLYQPTLEDSKVD